MRQRHIGFCPEGIPYVGLAALVTITFALLRWPCSTVIALVVTALTANFFRDPERISPEDPDEAVAPADGKVVVLERKPDPFTGEMRLCLCIFMNIFDVHVNRAPTSLTLQRVRYHPGLFLNASLDKASTDNERCALQLADAQGGRWTLVQIAGLVARRIVCFAQPGDTLERGQRFGLIKFGSRVDVYFPDGWEPLVRMNDRVLAGQTAIARRTSKT